MPTGFQVNGTEVGFFEDSKTHAEFYGYNQSATHQATNLTTGNVITQPGTMTTYVFAHYSTFEESYAVYIHHYGENDTTQYQSKVVWSGYGEGIRNTGYFFVSGVGVDRTVHGDTSYFFSSGDPIRNDGGGSYVYESGTTLTPGSAGTVVQDEIEDETATGKGADSYLTDSNGDPVTQHLLEGERGDGAGYGSVSGSFSFTLSMSSLTDGRDAGQPLPSEWVGVGPSGSVSASTSTTLTVDVSFP